MLFAALMSLGSALGRLQFSDQLKPDLVIAAGGRPQRPAHHNGLYSWLEFALSIGLGVAQTLENGDIVKLGSGGRGADKVTAEQQGIQRRQEFPGSKRLYDVTLSTGEERIAHDFLLSVLGEKQYVRRWRQFHDPAGHLNPVDVRETNIENDNIRLELGHFLDGSQSIPGFAHNRDVRFHCKSCRNELDPGRVIVYKEDPNS